MRRLNLADSLGEDGLWYGGLGGKFYWKQLLAVGSGPRKDASWMVLEQPDIAASNPAMIASRHIGTSLLE
jgi:hypothetical protein